MLIGCICSFERTVYFVPHRLPPMGNFYLTELSQAGKPKPMRGYSSISPGCSVFGISSTILLYTLNPL